MSLEIDHGAARLQRWCEAELFTPALMRASELAERYCDVQLAEVLRRLDLGRHLQAPMSGEALASALELVPGAATTLEAMLMRLALRLGVVRASAELPPRFQLTSVALPALGELEALRREMERLGPAYTAGLDFMDFGAEHFLRALRDDPDFLDRILSGRTGDFATLWHRATNEDPLQDLHGRMGAEALAELFPGGVILEIGGGTGNGIRHALRALERRGSLPRLERYVFTDISLRFILATRAEMRLEHPTVACEWRYVDLNRSLQEQKTPEESVDLIYGVNAAHVARQLVSTLRSMHQALRPGGQVMFAERLRAHRWDMAPRELTLNLSDYHRSAAERTELRPAHCYLTREGWHAALAEAGFQRARILPELPPEHPCRYAGVVIAEKR